MTWQQWVTFGIAVVGAFLGIYNAWSAHRRDWAQLRIVEDYRSIAASRTKPPKYEIRLGML